MPAQRTRTAVVHCTCAPHPRPHGTPHVYDYHRCGCDACRAADRQGRRDRVYRRHRTAAYPVQQRILLLRERGTSTKELALTLGYHINVLQRIAGGHANTVSTELARDVYSVKVPPRRKNL